MTNKKLYFIVLLSAVLGSCGSSESKEDLVENVNKNAAIETELSVQHIDTADVLITKHKIWKNKKLFKEIIKRDTIPSLGDSLQSVNDKDGKSHEVKAKKDYEFYITVQ